MALSSLDIWRRGPLGQNPYRRTAFRVARVPREAIDRALVVDLVSQIRQLNEADPEAHAIDGQSVAESDLNQAELVLLDPQRRMLEELLEHAVDPAGGDRLEALARQVMAHLGAAEDQQLSWTQRGALVEWTIEFCRRYLEQAAVADPTFGAAELELVPPWGRSGG